MFPSASKARIHSSHPRCLVCAGFGAHAGCMERKAVTAPELPVVVTEDDARSTEVTVPER